MAIEAAKTPWPRWLRPLAARPRLLAAAIAGPTIYLVLPQSWRVTTRGLVGWDSAILLFIALILPVMMCDDREQMRRRAIRHDEGRHVILLLAIVAVIASMSAIASELALAKGQGEAQTLRIALAVGTIVLSWTFVQLIFALHYAHVYYTASRRDGQAFKGGLEFPGEADPDYWDFLHFSVIIGATAQTADIAIVSKELRRIATLHSVLAFAFNTAILALMINLAAGLF